MLFSRNQVWLSFFLIVLFKPAISAEIGGKVGYSGKLSSDIESIFFKSYLVDDSIYGYVGYGYTSAKMKMSDYDAQWDGFSFSEVAVGFDFDVYDNTTWHYHLGVSTALSDVKGQTDNGFYIKSGESKVFFETGLSYQLSKKSKITIGGQYWIDQERWKYLNNVSLQYSWAFGSDASSVNTNDNVESTEALQAVIPNSTQYVHKEPSHISPTIVVTPMVDSGKSLPTSAPMKTVPIIDSGKSLTASAPIKTVAILDSPKPSTAVRNYPLYKLQIATVSKESSIDNIKSKLNNLGLNCELNRVSNGFIRVYLKKEMGLAEAQKLQTIINKALKVSSILIPLNNEVK
jgi:hypothetical protein